MSTDLKLERFGLELFNMFYATYEDEGLPLPVGKLYRNERSAMNNTVFDIVHIYAKFFKNFYDDLYEKVCHHPYINLMEFFQVITEHFPHRHLQKDPDEVMLKFVLSCSYFLNMIRANVAILKVTKGVNFYQKAHLLWAMFADLELKDEFYANGGWLRLHRFVWTIRPVSQVLVELVDPLLGVVLPMKYMFASTYRLLRFLKERSADTPLCLQWVDLVVKEERGPPLVNWTLKMAENVFRPITSMGDPHGIGEAVFDFCLKFAKEKGVDTETAVEAMLNYQLDRIADLAELQKYCNDIVYPKENHLLTVGTFPGTPSSPRKSSSHAMSEEEVDGITERGY